MFEALLELLFPRNVVCVMCRREAAVDTRGLCPQCREALRTAAFVPPPRGVDEARAAFLYDDTVKSPLLALKYYGMNHYARSMAAFMTVPPEWGIDIVIPVPLHKRRLRTRGYNQSELLARCICKREGLKLESGALRRIKDTTSQTHKHKDERIKNVFAAFAVVKPDVVKDKTILLVDDVITTGATLGECAIMLRHYGAKRIYALTYCAALD
jgi:ComF family protein